MDMYDFIIIIIILKPSHKLCFVAHVLCRTAYYILSPTPNHHSPLQQALSDYVTYTFF